jgi:hypothetical protein
MDNAQFELYQKERCEGQKDWYDRKSNANHRAFLGLQLTLIVCGAATPAILVRHVIELKGEAGLSVEVALGTSIIAAICVAVLRNFKNKEKWHIYRDAREALEREIQLFRARLKHYATSNDPQHLFAERVETIIANERARFKRLIGESEDIESAG